jgi:hypothetical protein
MAFFGLFGRTTSGDNLNTATVDELNPSAKIFRQDRIAEIESVIAQKHSVIEKDTNQFVADPFSTSIFNNLTYIPIVSDKTTRIRLWNQCAAFPECNWALREIADDFFHEDEQGNIINLKLPSDSENPSLNANRRSQLQDEFRKFIELFKLKEDGYILAKKFLIEGEVAYENIIDANNPLRGIIGVKYIPTDTYETLVDADTGRAVGIFFSKAALKNRLAYMFSGYSNNIAAFGGLTNNNYTNYLSDECIPMLWPQVTYINSGNKSPDNRIVFSHIDGAKQPYHQLTLLHDAMVILRITRAPERLVFNINTGNRPDKVARQEVKEFVQSMNARRSYNEKARISSNYNPVSMLESYYFWKSNANDGSSVESLNSTANYSEMDDVKYFLRRLFKQFNVPFARWEEPTNTLEKNDSLSREEYSFSRMIIRMQRRFAQGFKRSFITHLKLRDIWKQYSLTEADINIEFVRPVLYDLYQSQKMFTIQIENYSTFIAEEGLSKTIAMKRYLNYTDSEIEENNKAIVKEKLFEAACTYYANKMEEEGPKDNALIPSDLVWSSYDEASKEAEQEAEQEANEESGDDEGGLFA